MKLETHWRGLLSTAMRLVMVTTCMWINKSCLARWWPRWKQHNKSELHCLSIPSYIEYMIDKSARLSKTRRKRAVPDDWANAEALQTFKVVGTSAPVCPGARSLSLDASGDLALVGGATGTAGIYSISQNKVLHELFEVGSVGGVTDSLWAGSLAVFATASGVVIIFNNGSEVSRYRGHSGEITALAVHPSNEMLASVGVDKSYVLYDLTTSTQAMRIFAESSKNTWFLKFHPLLTLCRFNDGRVPPRWPSICRRRYGWANQSLRRKIWGQRCQLR